MNEIANLCELLGADVDLVRKGLGTDSRIGKRFLFPGIGYGGSCFPKDIQALEKSASDNGYQFDILKSVMSVNYKQRLKLIPLIKEHFNNDLQGKKIAVWGLAFKPQTDDIREAPALDNIKVFLDGGALVKVHDPEAMDNVKKIFNNKIEYFDNPYDAVKDVDCLFIATEWSEFRTPDFEKLSTLMKGKIIFDGRNLYDLENMLDKGFTYYSIGRKTIYG
jgi:UDPglucose 6-dehydrogenase